MKAALFDLDGVIIDTEGIYSEFWSEMGRKYGVPYPDFADRIKGTTLNQILNTYFPDDLHPKLILRLENFEAEMKYVIFSGVMDFLQQLAANNVPCAVVTSSGDDKLQHLWTQQPLLRKYFDAIITDSKVTKSKPDPQPYLIAAAELGCDPRDCYVFEDSYNGLLSGRRAGCTVIALATTNPADTLADKAELVIDTFAGFTYEQMLSASKASPSQSQG